MNRAEWDELNEKVKEVRVLQERVTKLRDEYEAIVQASSVSAPTPMPGANPVWCGRADTHTPHITVPGSAWCAGGPSAAHHYEPPDASEPIDWTLAVELAWVIIANAWGGDWDKATPEWRQAAERWRDDTLPALSHRLADRASTGPKGERRMYEHNRLIDPADAAIKTDDGKTADAEIFIRPCIYDEPHVPHAIFEDTNEWCPGVVGVPVHESTDAGKDRLRTGYAVEDPATSEGRALRDEPEPAPSSDDASLDDLEERLNNEHEAAVFWQTKYEQLERDMSVGSAGTEREAVEGLAYTLDAMWGDLTDGQRFTLKPHMRKAWRTLEQWDRVDDGTTAEAQS